MNYNKSIQDMKQGIKTSNQMNRQKFAWNKWNIVWFLGVMPRAFSHIKLVSHVDCVLIIRVEEKSFITILSST